MEKNKELSGRVAMAERVKNIARLMTLSDIVSSINGKLPDRKENFFDTINCAIALILRDTPNEPHICGEMYHCSLCGCNVEPVDNYCPKCGQAIDWNRAAEEK